VIHSCLFLSSSLTLENHGCDALIRHYFEGKIEEIAVPTDDTDVNQKMKKLLQQGAALMKDYKSKDVNQLIRKSQKKRGQSAECNCTFCLDDFLDSDSPLKCSAKILYASGVTLGRTEKPIHITKNFSLSKLKNMLLMLDHYYPGLSSPYFYLGKCHSFFPLHVEDASLWSINFIHFGLPKIW